MICAYLIANFYINAHQHPFQHHQLQQCFHSRQQPHLQQQFKQNHPQQVQEYHQEPFQQNHQQQIQDHHQDQFQQYQFQEHLRPTLHTNTRSASKTFQFYTVNETLANVTHLGKGYKRINFTQGWVDQRLEN